ncbi:MAG: type II toxin-antitoxin system HicA family toxin [Microgenomates group bacterium]|nr:type II toxin-antitoxin system HicA family toxin [Microgenomates group bacterium]
MPKAYSAKVILKILNKINFSIVSQKGSHIKLKGIRHGKILTVIVPNHKELAKGTFLSILKQAELTFIEFEELLRKKSSI